MDVQAKRENIAADLVHAAQQLRDPFVSDADALEWIEELADDLNTHAAKIGAHLEVDDEPVKVSDGGWDGGTFPRTRPKEYRIPRPNNDDD